MIEKFLEELEVCLKKHGVVSAELTEAYRKAFELYRSHGQSDFDVIRYFGEPAEIAEKFAADGQIPDIGGLAVPPAIAEPNIDETPLPAEEPVPAPKKEKDGKPATRTELILTDVFMITPGLILTVFGVVALGVVSMFMTAGGFVQTVLCWKLATVGQRVGGFFLSLMCIAISALFYFIIVWIVKTVVESMKRYVARHRADWQANYGRK